VGRRAVENPARAALDAAEVKDSSANFGDSVRRIVRRRIAISGIAGDQQAATIGQACFSPGMIKSTYGTGCFALLNTGTTPVASNNKLLTTIAYQLNGQRTYALEGSIFVAGSSVQWLRDGLGIIKQAAETGPLADKVRFRCRASIWCRPLSAGGALLESAVRGALFGLTRNTGPAELAHAALESVCYQTVDLLGRDARRLARCQGRQHRAARRRRHGRLDWTMQRLADLLDAPVDRPMIQETTALGAAYLAGLAAGVYPEPSKFADNWRLEHRFKPEHEPGHARAEAEGLGARGEGRVKTSRSHWRAMRGRGSSAMRPSRSRWRHVADAGGRLRQFSDAVIGLARLVDGVIGHPRRFLNLTADLVDGRTQLFGRRGHRLHIGGGFLGRGRDHGGEFLRMVRGRGERAGGRLEFGRGRCQRVNQFTDHRLEFAGGRADALGPRGVDRPIGVDRVIRRLLGDQGFLEDLQRRGDAADLGGFAAVGNLGGQFAVGQLPHRFEDRADAAADVANHIDRRAEAEHDRDAENKRRQADRAQIGCFGALSGHFRAAVIELHEFRERVVHGAADRHHLAGVDVFGTREIALDGKGLHIG
jgi:hypothetical protein